MTRPLILGPGSVSPPRRKRSGKEISLCGTLEGAVDMARMKAGFTHQTLGDRLGYTRAQITMLQGHKRKWTVEAIVKVCNITGDLGPAQWFCAQLGGEFHADPDAQRLAQIEHEAAEIRRRRSA